MRVGYESRSTAWRAGPERPASPGALQIGLRLDLRPSGQSTLNNDANKYGEL
jgi:hypothetical protein